MSKSPKVLILRELTHLSRSSPLFSKCKPTSPRNSPSTNANRAFYLEPITPTHSDACVHMCKKRSINHRCCCSVAYTWLPTSRLPLELPCTHSSAPPIVSLSGDARTQRALTQASVALLLLLCAAAACKCAISCTHSPRLQK